MHHQRPHQNGISALHALQAKAPALRERSARALERIAGELEPLLCNWETEALASALGSVYAATRAIRPELLSPRRYLRIFRLPASAASRSAFQLSVQQSNAETEALFNEMSLFEAAQKRRAVALRHGALQLQLEVAATRRALARKLTEQEHLDADLRRRASQARSEESKAAAFALLQKSASVRRQLRSTDAGCRAAERLQAACEETLQAAGELRDTLIDKVEPAWRSISAQLRALRSSGRGLSLRQASAMDDCQAELQSWLEDAMSYCERLQRTAAAGQAAIAALRG